MGLLVLLKEHHGAQDLARLADDLDLEIDEILPSSDFAEALGLVQVDDGRMTFTTVGRTLLEASIRERKTILRGQLTTTTLFRTLQRALESVPTGRLPEEEVTSLIALTAAPADDAVMNIVNWGRFTELFRYDPEARIFSLVRHRSGRSGGGSARTPPDGSPAAPPSGVGAGTGSSSGPSSQVHTLPAVEWAG